ncbi:Hypothetical_protein [Hexamita inflata]|uniref:Hypothetical_protein n=1 Tax=Hexamita inflata TaxID=28002 RepID=A0AA86PGJ6_9EUKA|nr:Hypothetical protein HINF_LOCUS22884 [Hexamita inflata]
MTVNILPFVLDSDKLDLQFVQQNGDSFRGHKLSTQKVFLPENYKVKKRGDICNQRDIFSVIFKISVLKTNNIKQLQTLEDSTHPKTRIMTSVHDFSSLKNFLYLISDENQILYIEKLDFTLSRHITRY